MRIKSLIILIILFIYSCSKKDNNVSEEFTKNNTDIINNTSFNNICLTKFKINDSKNIYDNFVNFILNKAYKNNYYLKNSEIKLADLSDRELVKFYDIMQECKGKGENIFAFLNVETKDAIWRRAISKSDSKIYFQKSLEKYNEFNFSRKNIFYNLIKTNSNNQFFSNSEIDTSTVSHVAKPYSPNAIGLKFRKLTVLHASVEAHNVFVGGISLVLNGLINAQNEHIDSRSGKKDMNAYEITPFYDILKRENFGEYEFVGFVKHYLDGKMYTSTIYKVNAPSKIKQFLVQPDPRFSGNDSFYIQENVNLYSRINSPNSYAYYISAVAAFASLYHGENGDENIDILHGHSYHGAFANVLVKRFFEPLRSKAGLPKIATVYTVHSSSSENGAISSNFFNRLGYTRTISEPYISFHIMALLDSDMINCVSKGVINSYTNSDPNISHNLSSVYNHLLKIDHFRGIPNGIEFEAFNPRNKSVLGSLHVASDLSDLATKKLQAKKILYDEGIISSSTKPLYLYVGRYSKEKGVDLLASFADYVSKHNGQAVFMGLISGPSVNKILDDLKNLNISNLKIYTDVKKDQLEMLLSIGVSKGNLIRFASDFTFIPSSLETFGLVAIEGLIMGSNLITTNVEGLQDITTPYDPTTRNIDTFNSVIFRGNKDKEISISNMISSLDLFNETWSTLTTNQKEDVQKRAIKYVERFRWDAKGGSCDQYKDLYIKAMIPLSPKNKKKHEEFRKNYTYYGYSETL